MATDAFGRLRTSAPFTTFNYYPSSSYTLITDYDTWVQDLSNGLLQYDTTNNFIKLSIGNGTTPYEYARRKTKVPMEYQPGKSRLIMLSGVMMTPVPAASTQIYSRAGIMDVSGTAILGGVWFEVDGSANTLKWCESVQTSGGTYTTTSVTKSSWNIDQFDGSGPSGKTLVIGDMSNNILLVIDQEWLGVGRIRCGFSIEGIIYYAHSFTHGAMSLSYTASPRLPIVYEISSLNYTAGTQHVLKQTCSTSISEGGYLPLGTRNSWSSNELAGLASTTRYILLALKVNPDYPNGLLKLINVHIANSSNVNTVGLYEIELHSTNGTIGQTINDASFSLITNSIAKQYTPSVLLNAVHSPVGYKLSSGLVVGNSVVTLNASDYETLLTRSICTKYDNLMIIASAKTGSPSMSATVDFIEST